MYNFSIIVNTKIKKKMLNECIKNTIIPVRSKFMISGKWIGDSI